ncbi:MAG TPA: hypothetical protein VIG24_16905 [Acidimicrobiia bacterium]
MFDPVTLFDDGTKGFLWLPSPSTTFTDDAASIAATVGDQIAVLNDESVNGYNGTQIVAADRPLLLQEGTGEYFFRTDGVSDKLSFPIDTATGSSVTAVWAIRNTSDPNFLMFGSAVGQIYYHVRGKELDASNALGSNQSGNITSYAARVNGVTQSWAIVNNVHDAIRGAAARVLTVENMDCSASVFNPSLMFDVNFSNFALTPSVMAAVDCFGVFFINRALTATERDDVEAYMTNLIPE